MKYRNIVKYLLIGALLGIFTDVGIFFIMRLIFGGDTLNLINTDATRALSSSFSTMGALIFMVIYAVFALCAGLVIDYLIGLGKRENPAL